MPVALLLPLLLLALHGEALPVSSCHDCLKDDGPLLTDASNLRNFQSVARGMDAFCEANARVHKCLDDCSTDREAVTTQLSFANFLCSTKVEEFRLIGECLGEDGSDSLSKCSDDCGADQQTALRFDSSSASPINPTALLDSLEGICAQQLCVLNCASHDLNRRCAGSGGLLKDLARRQVVDGSEILAAQSANGSNPAAQELAQRYVADLPGGCAFVKDPEVFDKVAVDTAPEETETGSEFATESSDIPTFSLNPDLIGAFDDVSGASGESGEAEGSGFQSSGEDASGEDLPPISPPEVPEDVDDEPSGEEPTAAPPQTTETVLTVNDEKERQLETNRVDIGGADSFKSPSQASSRSAAAVVAVLPLLAFFF